ncbi:hypothetical protein Btru_068288 [Bulinus truncatus]|nr:hypothetical protein Btru_068288 [Bulinus truncatus]
MSGFDPSERESSRNVGEVTKYPLKRLELSIKKFIKVLEIDLDRLHKHTVSITRVKDEELFEFDARVEEVKIKAIESMKDFMKFAGSQTDDSLDSCNQKLSSSSAIVSIPLSHQRGSDIVSGYAEAEVVDSVQTTFGSLPAVLHTQPSELLNLHVVPQNSEATASWEELQENILELNALVHEFTAKVEEQKEKVTNIEENIDNSHENIKEGTQHLAKAGKYKSALLPVVGAVVGGVVAGPVGLVAGMKIGGLAGAVGGAVGFAGGRLVKKHQEKISAMELENMSDKRSVSLPDLPVDEMSKDNKLVINQVTSHHEESSESVEEKSDDVFTTVTSSFRKFFSFSDE